MHWCAKDLVAMRAIIDLLRHPDKVDWVQLEAEEAGSIDDARVRYRDNREVRTHVKFAMDAEDAWD